MQEILINVESKELRCAVMKHGKLQDLLIERKRSRQMTGNIYKGRVHYILANIQSAFVDIGEKENGFMLISDAIENSRRLLEMFDLEGVPENLETPQIPREINDWVKEGEWVMVQVVKEPIGNKGARLTCNISVPGRYLVLLPNTPHRGVSRKIEERNVRERLKRLVRGLELPANMGLICRTACRLATPEEIQQEAQELLDQWQQIIQEYHSITAPQVLYQESSLIKRAILMGLDRGHERILIDDPGSFHQYLPVYEQYLGEAPLKFELYRDRVPIFERFNVEREIEKSLRRKLWLNSGGYLYFDQTEAMTTIDVNSGRSRQAGGQSNLEEALVRINLEAAEEIARQLRIRNIGGLIVCDFIDMNLKKNHKRVLEHLRECMREDEARCSFLGMSDFGLIEMTRQRTRESLEQTYFCSCRYCEGSGQIKSHETVSIDIERALKKVLLSHPRLSIQLITHPELDRYLSTDDKEYFQDLAQSASVSLTFGVNDNLHLNDYSFVHTHSRAAIAV